MNRIEHQKTTMTSRKVRMFSLLLAVIFVLSQGIAPNNVNAAGTVYLDGVAGSNENSGSNADEAVRTLNKAKKLLGNSGTILVSGTVSIKNAEKWSVPAGITITKAPGFSGDIYKVRTNEDDKQESKVTPEIDEVTTETPEPTKTVEKEVTPTSAPEVKEAVGEVPEVKEEVKITPEVKEEVKVAVTATPELTPVVVEEVSVTPEPTQEVSMTPEPTQDSEITQAPELIEQAGEPQVGVAESITPILTKIPEVSKETPVIEEPAAVSGDGLDTTTDIKLVIDVEEEVPVVLSKDVEVDELTVFLSEVGFMIEDQLEVNNILAATIAYEALDEATKAQLPEDLFKRLRAAQLIIGNTNKVSGNISVAGDLPWYVEFRAVKTNSASSGTFDLGSLVGSYELKLWNTLTNEPYILAGAVTVTIPVDNPAKYKNLSVIHYLADGSYEILNPTTVEGENAISFVTTSFSPYELVGNTNDVYNHSSKTSSSSTTPKSSNSPKTSNNTSGSSNTTSNSSRSSSTSSGKSTSNETAKTGKTTLRSTGAKTGDSNNILMMTGIGAGAGAIVGVLLHLKKRKNDKNKNED